VASARQQLEAAATARGWEVDRIQVSETFARLHIRADADVLVDIGIDVSAGHSPVVSMVGPTFAPEELAGRKLVALFDRAEARDFADVFVLVKRFGRQVLLDRAGEIDRGFDTGVLAVMMRTLDRFMDEEIPADDASAAELWTFFAAWADELERHPLSHDMRSAAEGQGRSADGRQWATRLLLWITLHEAPEPLSWPAVSTRSWSSWRRCIRVEAFLSMAISSVPLGKRPPRRCSPSDPRRFCTRSSTTARLNGSPLSQARSSRMARRASLPRLRQLNATVPDAERVRTRSPSSPSRESSTNRDPGSVEDVGG